MEPASRDQVAVYIDFDNIVMSRYDELHGREAFRNDNANATTPKPLVRERLTEARVDLAAIIDYASTFGTVVLSRAYADWSRPVPKSYAADTLRRSIDLVQMFPMTGTKNGADIRLAIDVTDDLAQYRNITHVMVVAGDSDYVSLAQRCKRRGRMVIGVGAGKSVGKYWESACDEFRYYEALIDATTAIDPNQPATQASDQVPGGATAPTSPTLEPEALLIRAARLLYLKATEDWIRPSGLKVQMKKIDPAFDENALGHKSFGDFLRSMDHVLAYEVNTSGGKAYLRERGVGPSPEPDVSRPVTAAVGEVTPASTDHTAPAGALARPSPRLTDLGGRPLSKEQQQDDDPEPVVAEMRRILNLPVNAVIGLGGETAMTECAHIIWETTRDGRPALPVHDVDAVMQSRGHSEVLARRARGLLTLCAPIVVQDEGQVFPNEELELLRDSELMMTLRRLIADKIRQRLHPTEVSAVEIAAATHASAWPPDVEVAYIEALSSPGFAALTDAIGPMIVPAPIIWDVAAAFIGAEGPVGRLDQFTTAMAEPLAAVERDPETVPLAAVHQSFLAAGLIAPTAPDSTVPVTDQPTETDEVVGRVLVAWLRTAVGSGLDISPDDPVTMESIYRLVLPDRRQRSWRAWVRDVTRGATRTKG